MDDAPCTWYGIECVNNSVYRLQLDDNGLAGPIPSLASLGNLYFINFNFNQLTGSMPDLSGLTALSGADLYDNQFSGSIPALNNLPELSYLNLGSNALTGNLPESLGSLPSLGSLTVDGNRLSGEIPDAFADSSIEGFNFDVTELCIRNQAILDWLDTVSSATITPDFCWSLVADLGSEFLGSGDTLELYARILSPDLTRPLLMDLYLSVLLPDGETEAFLILGSGGISAEMASTDPATWVPAATNFELTEGIDTGLVPIFSYPLSGSEPVGTYTWRFRATEPGSTTTLQIAESELQINPAWAGMTLAAPDQGLEASDISLQLNTVNDPPGIIYHWDFDDGTTAELSAATKEVAHQFSQPDRYLIKVTAELNGVLLSDPVYHHINIGRAMDDTIYPQAGSNFSASSTEYIDFTWNDCDADWQVYHGKYFKLWFEASEDSNVERQVIVNGLLFADYLFEAYSEIFTWDYLPTTPALDIYICRTIPGAGTGTGGTFTNNDEFIKPAGQTIFPLDYSDYVHEFIHAWDFRGSAWISSLDSAHAFTGGMEPIMAYLLGTGQGISSWGGDAAALKSFSGEYLFNHYLRVHLGRYLSTPELSWTSYFTSPFESLSYEDLHIPENKEHMLVPGGILMSLFSMHGLDGLQKVFGEIERQLLQHPEWLDGVGYSVDDQQTRVNTFMKAVADALALDVSDYFAYWKWPIAGLDDYMAQYPLSDKIEDGDGDGFSPLQGDLNDSDASVFPYAPELIDGVDNNLDGLIDETVYTENDGDIDTIGVALPATITASIADLNDEDSFQFNLTQAADVSIVMYSKDSTTTVPYSSTSTRDISVFAGTVYLDGGVYAELVHDAMSAPEALSAQSLSAGTHTLKVSPINLDGRNPNPGDYEIQLFINDFDGTFVVSELLEILYSE
ncbi:PKD domain-containing protein [Gammaproteobacteria bacterium]|nr:PKD domain-containing protein [Gammaproteobacteria bacterium]